MRTRILLSALLLCMTACGATAPTGTPTPTPLPAPHPQPGGRPEPTTVKATFDTARHSDVTYVASTGQEPIEVTAADGTAYSLSIPDGALPPGQPVRLTVLSSVQGGGLNGIQGGVRIEPEGMVFARPATLTIAAAPAPDGQQSVGFTFQADGQRFGLSPAAAEPAGAGLMAGRAGLAASSGGRVALTVTRAQTYGSGYASASAVHNGLDIHPADLWAAIADHEARGGVWDASALKELDTFLLYSDLDDAGGLADFISMYQTWRELVAQAGLLDDPYFIRSRVASEQAISQAAVRFAERVKANCTGTDGAKNAWEALYVFEFVSGAAPQLLDALRPLSATIEHCLTFEFRFDSQIDLDEFDHRPVIRTSGTVSAATTLSYSLNYGVLQGSTDLHWDAYTVTPNPEWRLGSSSTTDGRFMVVNYAPQWTLSEFRVIPTPAQREPRLLYLIDAPRSSYSVSSRTSTVAEHDIDDHWHREFFMQHDAEGDFAPGPMTPMKAQIRTPPGVVVQYVYDRNFTSIALDGGHETTHLSIIHRPR